MAGWRGGRASKSATSGSGQAVRFLILLCREVAGWRLVCVNMSLLPKFPLWYEIVLAGWRSGSVSHSGRLWNGICSVSVIVHLGFGNEPQRSKLNCDSHSMQWLCEGKIYFVFNFWKASLKQFDGSSMGRFPTKEPWMRTTETLYILITER